jgi:Raf kinase inhibitor-like YbhB/YbcL family protein
MLALAAPADAASLSVKSSAFKSGHAIPGKYAFCVPAAQGHVGPGDNINPQISWSKGPKGTKSYAIIAKDPDVPAIRDDMNKEGKTLPVNLKRRDFYHWVLVDIPADATEVGEGVDSNARVVHGKPPGPGKVGIKGVNTYGEVFASNEQLKGTYGGYDGPCPPWNDLRVHHYHFTVYALNVASLGLTGNFTGPDVEKAMKGHVLAKGEVVGEYSQNPPVAAKLKK